MAQEAPSSDEQAEGAEVTVVTTLSRADQKRLKAVANGEYRTVAAHLRWLIIDHLDRQQEARAA